jgi:hypothetical protein
VAHFLNFDSKWFTIELEHLPFLMVFLLKVQQLDSKLHELDKKPRFPEDGLPIFESTNVRFF